MRKLSSSPGSVVQAAVIGLLVAAGLLFVSGGSVAAEKESDEAAADAGSRKSKQALARERFEEAKALYLDGKYREAIEKLKQAISFDPAGAELYYNLGVVNEKLGRVDDAISAYQQYMEMVEDKEERDRVGRIIKRLRGAKHELKHRKMIPVPVRTKTVVVVKEKKVVKTVRVPAKQREKEKGRFDGWVVATGSMALVAAGVGGYFGYLALKDKNVNPVTGENVDIWDLEDRFHRSRREAMYADISFGVAGAFAVTSLLLYFTRDAKLSDDRASERNSDHGSRDETSYLWTPVLAPRSGGASAGVAISF